MVVKRGTWINGLAVAEPPLLALAVPGLVWLAREALADRRARAALIVAGGLALLGLAQSASLLVAPNDPAVSTRPFAASGPRRELSAGQVDALVAAARRCPAKQAYAGTPYVAFLARRRLPGRQPDPFITAVSTNRRFARLADADRSRCAA